MNQIIVTVTGPGETFNTELEAIRSALEAIGCTVEVENQYPSNHPPNDKSSKRVRLVADHQPWGG